MLLLILTHFHLDVPTGRRTSGCSINIFCMKCGLTMWTIWSSQNYNRSERKICPLPSSPEFQLILLPFTQGMEYYFSKASHFPEHLFCAYNYAEHSEYIKEQAIVPRMQTPQSSWRDIQKETFKILCGYTMEQSTGFYGTIYYDLLTVTAGQKGFLTHGVSQR